MKILNFGSINVDYVYAVHHFVKPAETIPASGLSINPGGKGANQSVALARGGATVLHAGLVGNDTKWMIDRLNEDGVDTTHVHVAESGSGGQAFIQVTPEGQNAIIVFGGTNQAIPESLIPEALSELEPGDFLVLQNEINLTPQLIQAGHEAGLFICFNPAPMTPEVFDFPLDLVNLFIVNEIEGAELAKLPLDTEHPRILDELVKAFPNADICLTRGEKGALFFSKKTGVIVQDAYPAKPVDTTAAGDTFTGFLLAGLADGFTHRQALDLAAKASAIAVQKPGAMDSIPFRKDVL